MVSGKGVDARSSATPISTSCTSAGPDEAFLAAQQAKPGTVVALLPGSRRHEIRHNLDAMVRSAGIIHARRPDVRFLIACLRPEHAQNVQDGCAAVRCRSRSTPAARRKSSGWPIRPSPSPGRWGWNFFSTASPPSSAISCTGSRSWGRASSSSALTSVWSTCWRARRCSPSFWPPVCRPKSWPATSCAGWTTRRPTARSGTNWPFCADRVAEPGACDRAAEVILGQLAGDGKARRAG